MKTGLLSTAIAATLIGAAGACAQSCPCDITQDGTLNSEDFFEFLNLFASGDIAADTNGDGAVNSADFFGFVNCFNEGCLDVPIFDRFLSPDPAVANDAYLELFGLGLDGIDVAMDLVNVGDVPFSGDAHQSEFSSVTARRPVEAAIIAMVLIDGIILDTPTPHYSAGLLGPPAMPPDFRLEIAIGAYNEWYGGIQGLPLPDVQGLGLPLDGFGGPVFLNGPFLLNDEAPAEGTREDGTATPGTLNCAGGMPDGPDEGDDPDPYAWRDTPSREGGPVPYNCLAWALGETDRWLSMPDERARTTEWKTVLTDYGYDVNNECNCNMQCPDGRGPKVMMVFHVPAGQMPNDSNWKHAMKQQADGNWSSKNGRGSRYKDIGDYGAFLRRHYPAPEGTTLVTKCFCKPAT